MRWTGLAPWEFKFLCPGGLTSTFLGGLTFLGLTPRGFRHGMQREGECVGFERTPRGPARQGHCLGFEPPWQLGLTTLLWMRFDSAPWKRFRAFSISVCGSAQLDTPGQVLFFLFFIKGDLAHKKQPPMGPP